jgi:Ca2+-binding RTX toxin-like protein
MNTVTGYIGSFGVSTSIGARLNDDGTADIVLATGLSGSAGKAYAVTGNYTFVDGDFVFEGKTVSEGWGTPIGSPVTILFMTSSGDDGVLGTADDLKSITIGGSIGELVEAGVTYEYTTISGEEWNSWEFEEFLEGDNSTDITPYLYENLLFNLLSNNIEGNNSSIYTSINRIIRGSSNSKSNDATSLVSSLEKIIGLEFNKVNPNISDVNNRIYEISKNLDINDEVINLTDKTPADILVLMNSDDRNEVAIKYSLVNLNSFALVSDHLYDGFDTSSIYEQYGESQYWLDRANFLALKLASNVDNQSYSTTFPVIPKYTLFQDLSSGDVAKNYYADSNPNLVIFSNKEGGYVQGKSGSDHFYGNIGSDVLIGGKGKDTIYGGDGIDFLISNNAENEDDNAADKLFGGKGNDIYYMGGGDVADDDEEGNDTYIVNTESANGQKVIIDDEDKVGSLILNGSQVTYVLDIDENLWRDSSHEFSMSDDSLIITDSLGNQVEIKNFTSGDLGITLGIPLVTHDISEPTSSSENKIIGDYEPVRDQDDNIVYDGIGNIVPNKDVEDKNRRDRIFDTSVSDFISARGGDDRVYLQKGGNEKVLLGDGDDQLFVNSSYSGNAFAEGGSGHDLLYSGSAQDVVFLGGDDVDALAGGSGNDSLYSDGLVGLSAFIQAGREENGLNQRGDFLYGGSGKDHLYGSRANDFAIGGNGDDIIVSGAGDDFIWGDRHVSNLINSDWKDWSATIVEGEIDSNGIRPFVVESIDNIYYTDSSYYVGKDTIYAGSGNDYVDGDGGDDHIYLESGHDTATGGIGNDLLDGGDGDDDLMGGEGNDTLYGRAGNDEIHGDYVDRPSGVDYLYGGSGNDQLLGGGLGDFLYGGIGSDYLYGDSVDDTIGGNDLLYGELGDDFLYGYAGNDELVGGTGVDYLNGGAGDDTYYFAIGDAKPHGSVFEGLYDNQGENNKIVFGLGIRYEDIRLSKQGNHVYLYYFDEGFAVNDGLLGTISSVYFTQEDRTYSFNKLVGDLLSTPVTAIGSDENDLLMGGASNDELTGNGGADEIYTGKGTDIVQAGAGDDIIIADEGEKTLYGDAGDDAYIVTLDNGSRVTIEDLLGTNTIKVRSAFVGQATFNLIGLNLEIVLADSVLTITNWENTDFSSITLPDGSVWDTSSILDNLNTAPLALEAPDVQVLEDDAVSIDLNALFNDNSPETLNYEVTLKSGQPLPDWLEFNLDTKLLSGVPENNDVGVLDLVIKVTDPGLLTAEVGFKLNVLNTNDAPFAVNDVIVASESSLQQNFSVALGSSPSSLEASETWVGKHGDGTVVFWKSYDVHENIMWNYQKLAADGSLASDERTLDLAGRELIRVYNANDQLHILSKEKTIAGENIETNGSDKLSNLYTQFIDDTLDLNAPEYLINNVTQDGWPYGAIIGDSVEVAWSTEEAYGVIYQIQHNIYEYYRYATVDRATGDQETSDTYTYGVGNTKSLMRLSDQESALVFTESFGKAKVLLFNAETSLENEYVNTTFAIESERLKQTDFDNTESYVFRIAEDRLMVVFSNQIPADYFESSKPGLLYTILNTSDRSYSELANLSDFNEQQRIIDVDYVESEDNGNSLFITYSEKSEQGTFLLKGRFITPGGGPSGEDLLLAANSFNDFRVFDDQNYMGNPLSSSSEHNRDDGDVSYNTIVSGDEVISVWSSSEGVNVSSVSFGQSTTDNFIFDPLGNDYDIDARNVSETLDIISVNLIEGLGVVDIVDGKVHFDAQGAYDYLEQTETVDILIEYTIRDSSGLESSATISSTINGKLDQNSFDDYVVFKPVESHTKNLSLSAANDYVRVDFAGFNTQTQSISSTINLGDGDNTLAFYGGGFTPYKGDFNVIGGIGFDTYIVATEFDGELHIRDMFGENKLLFKLPLGEDSISLTLGSLKIAFDDYETEIHLENFDPNDVLGGPRDIDYFEFNGVGYTYAELVALGFDLNGDELDNHIKGTSVVDRISGGFGNDILEGGKGNDDYLFNLGDGHDVVIDNQGLNKLILDQTILLETLDFAIDGDDLVISISENDSIRVSDWRLHKASSFTEIVSGDDSLTTSDIEGKLFSLEPLPLLELQEDQALEDINLRDYLRGYAGAFVAEIIDVETGEASDWLSLDDATGEFIGTPLNEHVGDGQYTLRVTSEHGDVIEQHLSFTVSNVNDTPEVNEQVGDQSIDEDAEFSYSLPDDLFSDIDVGDQLTLSVTLSDGSPLPSWLTFDVTTSTLSGTPDNGDVGELSISVTATDLAGGSAEQLFSLVVNNVNDSPEVNIALIDQATAEDAEFTFALPEDLFTDVDAGDQLTLSATLSDGSPLPSWLTFDVTTSILSGTPENGDVGELSLSVTATDLAGASVSQLFSLVVSNVNDSPEVNLSLVDLDIDEDAEFSYTLPDNLFSDVDAGDQLTLSATLSDGAPLPSWLRFDAESASLSGIPENSDVGSLSVGITATDLSGASVQQSFTLMVNNTNDSPDVISTLPTIDVTLSEKINLLLPDNIFADIDVGDQLSISLKEVGGSSLPEWLSYDPTTKLLTGLADLEQLGSNQIEVIATDLSGAQASFTFSINITANSDDALGTDGDDFLVSGLFNSQDLHGGAGDDYLVGFYKDDQIFGGSGDDTLIGGFGRDQLHGGKGNDWVSAGFGNDVINAGAGDDVVYAGSGSDMITGGQGDDYLSGGWGDDQYLIGRDEGRDTIEESNLWGGGDDLLSFTDGISKEELWFELNGNDLVVSVIGTDSTVNITGWNAWGSNSVERIEASGESLDVASIDALVQAMAVFDAPSGAGEEIPQHVNDQLQPVLASSWQPTS